MARPTRDYRALARAWLVPFVLLLGAFALIYGAGVAIDVAFHREPARDTGVRRAFFDVLFHPQLSEGTVQQVLGTIGQVVPQVLGIAITVVAIIVELASNRYTSQVTDLFIRDRVNLAVIGLFVVSSLLPLWVGSSFGDGYVPVAGYYLTLVTCSASIIMLVPYFSYVFTFLQPANIIQTIRRQIDERIDAAAARGAVAADDAAALVRDKQEIANSIEQIADIALNSILQRDRALAIDAIDALRGVVFDYLERKPRLPDAWFKIHTAERRSNPDYVTLSDDGLEDLEQERTWLEHKVMKQTHLVFVQALNNLRDLNNVIAQLLRDIALEALRRDDRSVSRLAIKFINTSLRSTFAAKDVRSAYNVLHQYRVLGESLVRERRLFLIELLFGYFKYYGILFDSGGMGFILETVSYDLYRLCRVSLEAGLENFEALLTVFLDVDRPPDSGPNDAHLRGVRKAQSMLAAFCLARDRVDLARKIGDDMRGEPRERLRSLREEIHAAERHFWEVTDRGVNFDFLEPELRPHLDRFFDEILAVGATAATPR